MAYPVTKTIRYDRHFSLAVNRNGANAQKAFTHLGKQDIS